MRVEGDGSFRRRFDRARGALCAASARPGPRTEGAECAAGDRSRVARAVARTSPQHRPSPSRPTPARSGRARAGARGGRVPSQGIRCARAGTARPVSCASYRLGRRSTCSSCCSPCSGLRTSRGGVGEVVGDGKESGAGAQAAARHEELWKRARVVVRCPSTDAPAAHVFLGVVEGERTQSISDRS